MEHDVTPRAEEIAVFCSVKEADEERQGTDRQPSGSFEHGCPLVLLTAFFRQDD